ncbi:hypothetical protein NL676_034180 [Syzygium grande]|nr:hypothetical protein NL676_034180 [Syzygium grande]
MAARRTTSKLAETTLVAINAASAPPKCSAAEATYTLSCSHLLFGSTSGFINSINSWTNPLLRETNVLTSVFHRCCQGSRHHWLRFEGHWLFLSGLLHCRKAISV